MVRAPQRPSKPLSHVFIYETLQEGIVGQFVGAKGMCFMDKGKCFSKASLAAPRCFAMRFRRSKGFESSLTLFRLLHRHRGGISTGPYSMFSMQKDGELI